MSEKYVLHGEKPRLPVPQENTGSFIYKQLSSKNRSDVVFINSETDESLTCGELLENSRRLSQSFCSYKVIHDKVIAICSENHINYYTIVFGALYAGIPIVFINPNYTEYELQHALTVTKPDMIFCTGLHLRKFIKLKSNNRFIRKIVTIDSTESSADSDSLKKFINQHSDEDLASMGFTTRQVDINDHVAFILFSSGTTGLPKAVMLTHLSVNTVITILSDPEMENPYDDIMLAILPFFHIYGLYATIISLCRGRKVVVLDKFEPEIYLKNVQKYKSATLVTVPPLLQFLLKNKVVDEYDLSCVKEIFCGAAPLAQSLIAETKKKFNLKLVRHSYGMTEAGLIISVPPLEIERPGSVGTIFPSLSCVIKDIDTGKNLGPNQKGQICIKGSPIMKGYFGNEQATRDAFTHDGWLKTGDIGYYDDDGYLYVVDRIKELIKYKGFQVAPAELEAILINNPKIKDAGVVGLPDDDAGELPLAFVVKQPDVTLTEKEVQNYVAQFVSRNKHLHGGVIFVNDIPRNPSGKILRKELKKLVLNIRSKL